MYGGVIVKALPKELAATDTRRVERMRKAVKGHQFQRKLTDEQVKEIVNKIADKAKQRDLASEYEVSEKTISVIKSKYIEKINTIREANAEIVKRELKVRAIEKVSEIIEGITGKKIDKSNLKAMTSAARDLIAIAEGENNSNINLNFNLGSLLDKATKIEEVNSRVVDITPKPDKKGENEEK